MWLATVTTHDGLLGPLRIADGVFQRAIESASTPAPTLRFAGQLSTTRWDIETRIGRMLVMGAAGDGSAVDPSTASARTHHPSMTLVSKGYAAALSSLDVPLLLLRSDLAPRGCEFSEFRFSPTGLRIVHDLDLARARADLRMSDSYLWLGSAAELGDLPLAHIDLTRARVDVAKPESLARLAFLFSGLYLDIAGGQAWISDTRARCRVLQRVEPGADGASAVLDTRPVLVVEFPPQHVFEEAVFRPGEAPLPDVLLPGEPTFPVEIHGAPRNFSKRLPDFLRELATLATTEDHLAVRRAYAALKRNRDRTFADFADAFERRCNEAIASGVLPPPPDPRATGNATAPVAREPSLSPAYPIYIGADGLPPELMTIGRAANKEVRDGLVRLLLDASLHRAGRFIALLKGDAPEPEDISSRLLDIVKSVLAWNPFKSAPELPIPPRDYARLLEQATSGVLQDYASFRDFYAEQMLLEPGVAKLLPDDMEFFSPGNQKDLEFMDRDELPKRHAKVKAAYVELLRNAADPLPVMRARLSGTSRLAFHVDCGSRPRVDVEGGDAPAAGQGGAPGTRLPFTFDALTDWANYDMAVTPRARQPAAFDAGGVLIRRESDGAGGADDESVGADIAMLISLGIRSGQAPQRPQRAGRPRDWGKKLRTLQERLTDVEASLSAVPDELQTAIEIPARLILSPCQKGQWRTRRGNLPWARTPAQLPVPLWTASLDVDAVNPLVRAVASPDMRPEFVRFGLDRSLFAYQRTAPKGNTLHAPAGAAPPRGPRAPWTLGFEESDPNTSGIQALFKATQVVPDAKNRDEDSICAGSAGATTAAATSAASAAASSASAASSPGSPASAPEVDAVPALHPLVDYLCTRGIDRRRYRASAVFRSTLDAYDRHEIVLLSSTWGLPVRGRREKTGQLQALRFSSQVELPEEWRLLDAQADTAIYRPRALKVQELSLTALGGTLRHDSDFVPPAAARHVVHGPLFDSMSVERWQHWTVLGRDVFAEVVYKGYLFPIGHRASLVKQTERVFLRPAGSPGEPAGPVRCYLRQRMFIRVARPDKAFPAYGQPNGGRMFPADVVQMLTQTTPDIVDPTEDTGRAEPPAPAPGGRLWADEAGLVFWPRTSRIEGAEVVFDMRIQNASTRGKLIFVDNVAANRADLMDRLVAYYNGLPSPDLTPDHRVVLETPDLQRHLRTLDLQGHSLRYCDEIKPGSASHKTLSWTLKATGGVGIGNIARGPNEVLVFNDYEGPLLQFDDPLLEGADQPPFFPAIQTARIRIDQVERLTGGVPQTALAQFEGWYVQNGFERSKRTQEKDALGIYLDIVNTVTIDMGRSGDRSGGVMRPAGAVIALSRERGPLTGTGGVNTAGVVSSVVGQNGFPLVPQQDAPVATLAAVPGGPAELRAKQAFGKFFGGNGALDTKLLGLVSIKSLINYLDVKNAAAELPLLREAVEYGMSGAEAAAGGLRTNIIAPLHELVQELTRQWRAAGAGVNRTSDRLVGSMGDVFPDVDSALHDLTKALSASAANTDDAAVIASLSDIYECGRRLMDACGRVAANPLDQLQVAVKRKLAGFNAQIDRFNFTTSQLDPVAIRLAVNASWVRLRDRVLDGALARLSALQDRVQAARRALEAVGAKGAEALAQVEAVNTLFVQARAELGKAVDDAVRTAPTSVDAPRLQAEALLRSMMGIAVGALRKVEPLLASAQAEPGSDADKELKDLAAAVASARRHLAAAVADLSSPARVGSSPYQRALTNLTTLLRLSAMLGTLGDRPQALLAQVSQVLADELALQIGPRAMALPRSIETARDILADVLDPIQDGAKRALKGVVDATMVFPPPPLPDLRDINALAPGRWPASAAGGSSLVARIHAVAVMVHKAMHDKALKDPAFQPVRVQLLRLGTVALQAEVDLHSAAVGVQLFTQQLKSLDQTHLQAAMQAIDAAFSDLERLGEVAVRALISLRDGVVAIAYVQARDALAAPVRRAFVSALSWFIGLNTTLKNRVEELLADKTLESLLRPSKALLDQYEQRLTETRAWVEKSNVDDWKREPARLLPSLPDPLSAAEATGAQAVIVLRRSLADKVMDLIAALIEPAEAVTGELVAAFRPLLVPLKGAYAELGIQRQNLFDAAGKTAGQLLTGALLVVVDRNAIFVTGSPPGESETDASVPARDQLHWDTVSLTNLIAADPLKLKPEERLRAVEFMQYLVTGWRTGQSTPLRIVEQLKRLSLEEIRARLLALINFGAIREEIEERIKLLIPSAATMAYDFSTTMSAAASEATAGVFRPHEGCALSVRTRARVDLLKPSAPSFLSIGELGAFDIRLLGSFDAVTLHFKGVRFTSRGGAPECDLQYDGFTIGEKLKYLSQLTPFFGSSAGSGVYLQPLNSGIGIEAGYRLDLGAFTVGNLAIFNVSLNAAARLPFDNRGATFVASLSRRDSPFTIAVAPYGGSGFFALEADTTGIVGFEASFEYGGAGAFSYGPLKGQGRLMVGAYIRSRRDHTEIFATFYVGGSASIWVFNFGASLYVSATQQGSQMVGSATYTFSFSMGIVDYDYSVAVGVELNLDGTDGDKKPQSPAATTTAGDAGGWQDYVPGIRLAAFGTRPQAGQTAKPSAPRRPTPHGSKAKRRVATACQTKSWDTYSTYFDKQLTAKVRKKAY